MADALGIPRRFFQDHPWRWHHDLPAPLRPRAVELGAREVTMHEVGALLRRRRAASGKDRSRRFVGANHGARRWHRRRRFLRGVRAACPDDEITAVVNTGDDVTVHGLRICPDLDSVMYTLGGAHDTERGWGRADETLADQGGTRELRRRAELVQPRRPRHRDPPGAHADARRRLPALSDVTAALCERWQPGVRLLPMTDHRCETHVVVDLDEADGRGAGPSTSRSGGSAPRGACRALAFVQVGVDDAAPGARRARGDHRGRRRAVRAEQPGRQHRDDPRRARHPRRRARPRPRPSSGSRRSSAARRCAAWPTRACRRSASR